MEPIKQKEQQKLLFQPFLDLAKREMCDHYWLFDRNLGRCYNQYKCSHCGALSRVDSGD